MYVYHNGLESGWPRAVPQAAVSFSQRSVNQTEWSYYPTHGAFHYKIFLPLCVNCYVACSLYLG